MINMSKIKEMVTSTQAKVGAAVTAISLGFPMLAFAAEDTGVPSEIMTVITGAFTQLKDVATQILVLGVGAAVSVIVMSGGGKYALKQIRGVLGKAS